MDVDIDHYTILGLPTGEDGAKLTEKKISKIQGKKVVEEYSCSRKMGVENYHVIELVGKGSFGKVYKGRRKYTGQTVAMKFIMKHGKSDKDIHNLRHEIEGPFGTQDWIGLDRLICPIQCLGMLEVWITNPVNLICLGLFIPSSRVG
ncbi:hypothetical protein F8388_013956 [Cannabis sativa]|uniref:non-specific serine/threonine protein kinase n=1 Tax=Cannabis sativa TaxID=3483 RepID=A0A7J6F857_CANSA|nr:hypothetical protein F8388_013956 [Cannabis sativa]